MFGPGWVADPPELATIRSWTPKLPFNGTYNASAPPANYSGLIVGPLTGQRFAYLLAGAGANVYTYLNFTIEAQAGGSVTVDVKFDAGDALPYDDDAFVADVSIAPLGFPVVPHSPVVLTRFCVACVGSYGQSPWEQLSYTFTVTGTHVLSFAVRNYGDNLQPSALVSSG